MTTYKHRRVFPEGFKKTIHVETTAIRLNKKSGEEHHPPIEVWFDGQRTCGHNVRIMGESIVVYRNSGLFPIGAPVVWIETFAQVVLESDNLTPAR